MDTTVLRLCTMVLRDLRQTRGDDAPDDGDLQIAIDYLVDMQDVMQGDRLALCEVATVDYALAPGVGTYRFGPGQDFDTVANALSPAIAPRMVSAMTVSPVGQTSRYPVTERTQREWARRLQPDLTDAYPSEFYFELQSSLASILSVWPIPTTAATLWVSVPVPLVTPTDKDTVLYFPAGGYLETWRQQLAIRLQEPFGTQLSDRYLEAAKVSLGNIRKSNDPGPTPTCGDPAVVGGRGFDIRSNGYR